MDPTLPSLVAGLAFLLLIANILTTRHIWLDHRRTSGETVAETGLVWLVPFFGLLVALAISLDGPEKVRKVDPIATAGGAAGAVAGSSLLP